MSASYPLVRNLSAFSTRFGVLDAALRVRDPRRARTSSCCDEMLHLRYCTWASHCVSGAAIGRRIGDIPPLDARGARRPGPAERCRRALPRPRARSRAPRRAARIWAARAGARPRGLRVGVETGAGALLDRQQRPPADPAPRGVRARTWRRRAAPSRAPRRPEGPLLARREHGRAGRDHGLRRACGTGRPSANRSNASWPSTRHSCRDRRIARWADGISRCPRLFGGSNGESEAHLRKALTYNPQSTRDVELPRRDARSRWAGTPRPAPRCSALDAPLDPEWAPEDGRSSRRRRRDCGGGDFVVGSGQWVSG